jgi:hypothetical protein
MLQVLEVAASNEMPIRIATVSSWCLGKAISTVVIALYFILLQRLMFVQQKLALPATTYSSY